MTRDEHIKASEDLLVDSVRALKDGAGQRAMILTAMADVHARLAGIKGPEPVEFGTGTTAQRSIGEYPG